MKKINLKKLDLKKWSLKKKVGISEELTDEMGDVLEEMDMDELNDQLEAHEEEVRKNWNDDEKIQKILDGALTLVKKLSNLPFVGKYIADVPILVMLVNDYRKKEYTDIPLASVISITVALAYLVSPLDVIPDSLPLVGHLDDGVVLYIVLEALHNDIEDYRMWKVENLDE